MSPEPMKKTCFVSGAASGIGQAVAISFAKAGYQLAVVDLTGSNLQSTLAELNQYGGSHKKFFANIAVNSELSRVFSEIENSANPLTIAINCAGVDGGGKEFLEIQDEDYYRIMDINLKGTLFCMQNEIRIMSKLKHGSIINIASVLGIRGLAGAALYSASKHGILGLTKSLALQYATSGIRVNAICPGIVKTAMLEKAKQANPKGIESSRSRIPMQRFGESEEIADMAVWLASDQSAYITGQAMCIDGGLSAL